MHANHNSTSSYTVVLVFLGAVAPSSGINDLILVKMIVFHLSKGMI
jgi:hypothetical protein